MLLGWERHRFHALMKDWNLRSIWWFCKETAIDTTNTHRPEEKEPHAPTSTACHTAINCANCACIYLLVLIILMQCYKLREVYVCELCVYLVMTMCVKSWQPHVKGGPFVQTVSLGSVNWQKQADAVLVGEKFRFYIQNIIGERERANLVVRSSGIFYNIRLSSYVV